MNGLVSHVRLTAKGPKLRWNSQMEEDAATSGMAVLGTLLPRTFGEV